MVVFKRWGSGRLACAQQQWPLSVPPHSTPHTLGHPTDDPAIDPLHALCFAACAAARSGSGHCQQLHWACQHAADLQPDTCSLLPAACPLRAAEKGRERREKLEWPADVDPAADSWLKGAAWQTTMQVGGGMGHPTCLASSTTQGPANGKRCTAPSVAPTLRMNCAGPPAKAPRRWLAARCTPPASAPLNAACASHAAGCHLQACSTWRVERVGRRGAGRGGRGNCWWHRPAAAGAGAVSRQRQRGSAAGRDGRQQEGRARAGVHSRWASGGAAAGMCSRGGKGGRAGFCQYSCAPCFDYAWQRTL